MTNRRSTGQFLKVEQEIARGSWPYDNGDDPSFFVARNLGGPLTWGICRQNVRNGMERESIVVFFAYERQPGSGVFHYRLSGVATVDDAITHARVNESSLLANKPYLNLLIRRDEAQNRWVHDENDRPRGAQHDDWLWRIANHTGLRKFAFEQVQRQGWFDEQTCVGGNRIALASNYIVFSNDPEKTIIVGKPPIVATARNGQNEAWTCTELRELTIGVAEQYGVRRYLRTENGYGPAHPHITWSMESDCATEWLARLKAALRKFSA